MSVKIKQNKGFTLIELLVSIGIFVMMTSLLIFKYGNFNNGVLLTNMAYDVALAIRTAQTYGISVKGASGCSGTNFQCAYGVEFTNNSDQIKMFSVDGTSLDSADMSSLTKTGLNTYTLKHGAIVSDLCSGNGTCADSNTLYVVFKRPDPEAIICSPTCSVTGAAEVTIKSPDGTTKKITVLNNGQISVQE